jgi:hypothetical protein
LYNNNKKYKNNFDKNIKIRYASTVYLRPDILAVGTVVNK